MGLDRSTSESLFEFVVDATNGKEKDKTKQTVVIVSSVQISISSGIRIKLLEIWSVI